MVEAALFATASPLTVDALAELLDAGKRKVQDALRALMDEYAGRADGALMVDGDLDDPDSGYILTVRGPYARVVERLVPLDLSQSALRTLALIAARGPIAQTELVALRGSGAYEHVKELTEQGLVMKEQKGRSSVLRTSEKFAQFFKADPQALEQLQALGQQLGD